MRDGFAGVVRHAFGGGGGGLAENAGFIGIFAHFLSGGPSPRP